MPMTINQCRWFNILLKEVVVSSQLMEIIGSKEPSEHAFIIRKHRTAKKNIRKYVKRLCQHNLS